MLLQDDVDLEALIKFPFEMVEGVTTIGEEERQFYRPAHHAAIRAMIDYVHGAAE